MSVHGSIRTALLTWYDREKRSLPWRGTRDPYRIWVSEVMLQQTTVEVVRRRYAAFLERFPTLPSLARASEESVLAAWSGLGYYARARNLRLAAREIRARFDGRLPSDPAELERLPGFGRYTAGAVASLAFGRPVAAADANVTRVVSRLFALAGSRAERAHGDAVLLHAAALLPRGRPGDLTAAMMDLGQQICTARLPACSECPVARHCAARQSGDPEGFPRPPLRPAFAPVHLASAILVRGRRALLVRRRARWLGGLWEFPSEEAASAIAARRRLFRRAEAAGWELSRRAAARARHTIVRRRLTVEIFRGSPGENGAGVAVGTEARWFDPELLEGAAIPTLTRKIGKAAGFLLG